MGPQTKGAFHVVFIPFLKIIVIFARRLKTSSRHLRLGIYGRKQSIATKKTGLGVGELIQGLFLRDT